MFAINLGSLYCIICVITQYILFSMLYLKFLWFRFLKKFKACFKFVVAVAVVVIVYIYIYLLLLFFYQFSLFANSCARAPMHTPISGGYWGIISRVSLIMFLPFCAVFKHLWILTPARGQKHSEILQRLLKWLWLVYILKTTRRYCWALQALKMILSAGFDRFRKNAVFPVGWFRSPRFSPLPHGCVFLWKRKHFVALLCPVHTITMYRFRWKRKLLKTLSRVERFENATVSASCGRVKKTHWSCDVSPSPLSFENPWWKKIQNVLLLAWLWIGNVMLINLNNPYYTCAVEGW